MREAGQIAGTILKEVATRAKEGVSLIELDRVAEEMCYQYDSTPAFKGYEGFPATLCTGVNNIVVHGIPDEYVLKNGDIVSLDLGVRYKSGIGDTAVTVIIGEVSKEVKHFVSTVQESLYNAIKVAIPGNTVGDIGHAIQSAVEKEGYNVVRELVGHGVGKKLHEDPYIPGYGKPGTGDVLYEGQTIAIESIINQGSREIYFSDEDGWTTFTKDGKLSALFEHTVLVLSTPEILTKVE